MATHSIISYFDGEKYHHINCRWDGYIQDGQGVAFHLVNYYNNEALVKELISLGGLSSLEKNIHPPEKPMHRYGMNLIPIQKHNSKTYDHETCVFYHRDGDEDWEEVKPQVSNTIQEMIDIGYGEYVYCFKNNKWYVLNHNKEWIELPLTNLNEFAEKFNNY